MSSYLNEHFVSLADDCDHMAPEVRALGVKHLARARMLPFILLIDADENWLGGSSAATTPEAFLKLLQEAVQKSSPAPDQRELS